MLLLLSCGSEPAEKVLSQEEIVKATVEAKLAEDTLQATVLAEYSVALTATAEAVTPTAEVVLTSTPKKIPTPNCVAMPKELPCGALIVKGTKVLLRKLVMKMKHFWGQDQ